MAKREIKFRAWSKKYKFMHKYIDFLNPYHCGEINAGHQPYWYFENPESKEEGEGKSYSYVFEGDNVVWMQYTGLSDKNKKEIFEGDIVKQFCGQEGGSGKYIFDVIEYEGDGFRCKPSYEDLHSGTLNNFIEIIGNIYENPELLTKEDENAKT